MYATSGNGAFDSLDLRGSKYFHLEMVGGKNQIYDSHAGHMRSHHVPDTAGSTWTLRVARKRTPDDRPHRPGRKAIAVRTALPRPLTMVMMASLLMEEGALNKFQYIGMVAFLAMRLYDYHHRYLCRPHIYCALYVMDRSSARFTSILLFSILAPTVSAVRRKYISD